MHILIVEDSLDIQRMIAAYLEPLGHTLGFAVDGNTGLELAVGQDFDAIVLDLQLPGIDGLTLCRKLRSAKQTRTPVLMLSARTQLEDKLEGFKAGADDYLVKPFSIQELEARLKALVNRSQNPGGEGPLKVGDLEYDQETLEARRAGRKLVLNPIQRRLLDFLMRNSSRVVPRDELEQQIWGDSRPSNDVLRMHIYALRRVIDKPFDKKLLHTVHGAGYRLYKSSGGKDEE